MQFYASDTMICTSVGVCYGISCVENMKKLSLESNIILFGGEEIDSRMEGINNGGGRYWTPRESRTGAVGVT